MKQSQSASCLGLHGSRWIQGPEERRVEQKFRGDVGRAMEEHNSCKFHLLSDNILSTTANKAKMEKRSSRNFPI